MTNSKDQAQSLFLNALEIQTEGERVAYIEAQCGEDRELRKEVEELLEHARRLGPFLEPSGNGVEGTVAHHISERPGTVIGPYKLLQQIGEGGMGVVFMAEQTEPIQRTVALKIIKAGMDTRQVIARFEAERQALALMDHPNIARVLDAGTTDTGRPYFVMDLVKGVPVTDYCDAQHLSVRERVELMGTVCQAVQHAHQKGIIHRDIKPSNVLVAEYDGKPVPKVIDFGVAKATAQKLSERTMFTEFGQVIGTVEYMSPEQARFNQLDVDTRSDIYSLGVLLYELLTGSTPFERKRLREAAFDEVLRIIREEEPPKPSTKLSSSDILPSISANRHTEPARLSKDLCGELDWIVMKALEKDRNRRYETANGFAADLQRYLADEPVAACPPSTWYRFRKYARRNKVGLLAACGVLAALIVMVVVLAVSNRMIAAQRNETALALRDKERALAQAEAQSRRADANFWKAVISVRELMVLPATGWNEASPALRQQFGAVSLKFYQNLLQDSGSDPSARFEAAVGYRMMGTIRSSWQEYAKAEQMFRQSVDILNRLVAEHPQNREYRYELASGHLEFAQMLSSAGRANDAAAVRARGIELCEALVAEPPDAYEYLVGLAQLYREELEARGRASTTQQVQTCVARMSALYERALVAPRDPVKYPPVYDQEPHLQLGHSWRYLAMVLRDIGRNEEAERIFRRAIETFEQFQSLDPPSSTHFIADTWRRVGRLQVLTEKFGEAERSFRRAVEIHDDRAAKFPDFRINQMEQASAYLDLAGLLTKSGRSQEAVPLITRAARFDDPEVQHEVASCLVANPEPSFRNPKLATELAERAIAVRPGDGDIWKTLGVARYRNGQPKEAIAAIETAMQLRHVGDASDPYYMSMCHWQLGNKDEARKWYDKAIVWTDENQADSERLRRLRAEAEDVLRIAGNEPTTKEKSTTTKAESK